MKRKVVLLSILMGTVGLLFILSSSEIGLSADPILIKYADPSKAESARPMAARDTMLEIEKRTGGRVKHEFYWSGSLMKAEDVLNGIKAGTCDVGYPVGIVYHKTRFPLWQGTQLLFVGGNDLYGVNKAAIELYETNPLLKKEFDDAGVQVLTLTGLTPSIIISKMPLKEPGDHKGVRIRAVGPVAKFLATMGGLPNSMKYWESPEALARGVLDGVMTYLYASTSYKHYEDCKYLLLTGLNHVLIEYWINRDTLKKMPPDVRKIYLDTWRDYHLERVVKYFDEEYQKQISIHEKAGVNIYQLNSEQLAKWKKIAEPINEEYYADMEKKGVDGRKIVSQYQELYRKYERKR